MKNQILISEKDHVLYLNIDEFQTRGEHLVKYESCYMKNCMEAAIFAFNAIVGKLVFRSYDKDDGYYISYNEDKFYGQVIKYNDVFYKEKIIVSLEENKEIRFMLNNKMYKHARKYCKSINISCYIVSTNKICVLPTSEKPVFEKIREAFLRKEDSILIQEHELSTASARVYCVRISKVFKIPVSCKKLGNDTIIFFGNKDKTNDFNIDFINLVSKYYRDYSKAEILEICENSLHNFNSINDDDFND